MPKMVEVVLHDLQTHTIAHIENPFTLRKIGDSSHIETENYASDLGSNDTIAPYKKYAPDGSKLKSVSALIRDDQGQPIGLLCMNLRIDDFEKSIEVLNALSLIQGPETDLLKNDWREVSNSIIGNVLAERKIKLAQAKRADKLAIISKLCDADIFASRGSAEYISQALGISRANLYQLLREAR